MEIHTHVKFFPNHIPYNEQYDSALLIQDPLYHNQLQHLMFVLSFPNRNVDMPYTVLLLPHLYLLFFLLLIRLVQTPIVFLCCLPK